MNPFSSPKSVLVLDLWTDHNRGDYALQYGLISLIRNTFKGSKVYGVFRFGMNEKQLCSTEIALTSNLLDEILFSPRPTLYTKAFRIKTLRVLIYGIFNFASWIILGIKLSIPQQLLSKNDKKVLSLVRKADTIIVKGKNYRSSGSFVQGFTRFINLTILGWIPFIFKSKSVVLSNASIYPECTKGLLRILYREYFRRFSYISVRENDSQDNLNVILGNVCFPRPKIAVAPDLSLAFLRDHQALINSSSRDPYTLGVVLTDWGSETDQRHVLDLIRRTVEDQRIKNVIVIPQVVRKSESSHVFVDKLVRILSEIDITINLPELNNPAELLHIYSQCEFVISMRMHGAIFAYACGAKTFAIEYDTGPKWKTIDNLSMTIIKVALGQIDHVTRALFASTSNKYAEKYRFLSLNITDKD